MRRVRSTRVRAPLLFYTDGLAGQSGRDIDAYITRAGDLFSEHGSRPLEEVLDLAADEVRGRSPDDVALLAVRVPDSP